MNLAALHALPVRALARLRGREARPLRDRRDGEARRLLPAPHRRRSAPRTWRPSCSSTWSCRRARSRTRRRFPVLFTLAVLLVFNPLRTRLQAFVDRVFFRTRYDGAQVLAQVGGELGADAPARSDRSAGAELRRRGDPERRDAPLRRYDRRAAGSARSAARTRPAAARSAGSPTGRVRRRPSIRPKRTPTASTHDVVRASARCTLEAEIAVPMRLRERARGARSPPGRSARGSSTRPAMPSSCARSPTQTAIALAERAAPTRRWSS